MILMALVFKPQVNSKLWSGGVYIGIYVRNLKSKHESLFCHSLICPRINRLGFPILGDFGRDLRSILK